jgi:hypothetical protein
MFHACFSAAMNKISFKYLKVENSDEKLKVKIQQKKMSSFSALLKQRKAD